MGPKSRIVRMYSGVSDRSEVVHMIARLFSSDGGPGSGNHDHAGRPGKVGGSAPEGPSSGSSKAPKEAKTRFPEYHAKKKIEELEKETDKLLKKLHTFEDRSTPEAKKAEHDFMQSLFAVEDLKDELKKMKRAREDEEERLKRIEEAEKAAQSEKPKEWKSFGNGEPVKFSSPPESAKTLVNFEKFAEERNKEVFEKMGIDESDLKIAEDVLQKVFDECEFGMFIDPYLLFCDGGVMDSHFKNQFETGTSGGFLSNSVRKRAAKALFGCPKDIADEDREKYGALVSNPSGAGCSAGYGYGSCVVTFKKDNLKGRTTYTLTDSLAVADDSTSYQMAAGSVSVDKVTYGGDAQTGRSVINEIRRMKENPPEGGLQEFTSQVFSPYVELQYHGKLTMDDVATVCYKSKFELERNLSTEQKKTLKDKGIKVGYREGDEFVEI